MDFQWKRVPGSRPLRTVWESGAASAIAFAAMSAGPLQAQARSGLLKADCSAQSDWKHQVGGGGMSGHSGVMVGWTGRSRYVERTTKLLVARTPGRT